MYFDFFYHLDYGSIAGISDRGKPYKVFNRLSRKQGYNEQATHRISVQYTICAGCSFMAKLISYEAAECVRCPIRIILRINHFIAQKLHPINLGH